MAIVGLMELTPYHTHQVIELPVIRPDVTHWLLHQGQCLSCGKLCKATVAFRPGQWLRPTADGLRGRDGGHRWGQPQCGARPVCLGVRDIR